MNNEQILKELNKIINKNSILEIRKDIIRVMFQIRNEMLSDTERQVNELNELRKAEYEKQRIRTKERNATKYR